ncbi:hypothetical protein TWF718_009769 [Orbilia javanica]|uniref:F-box domain-containing protein n=1 Tax=Orbilia javanica TaxID=47235 RepID=A0AAN8NR08_9PEZI
MNQHFDDDDARLQGIASGLENQVLSDGNEGDTVENDSSLVLDAVPIEIWGYMLQFMTMDTVKAFSTCSKSFRSLALGVVFRKIFLNSDSLEAFRDGGLVGCGRFVRKVTFELHTDYTHAPTNSSVMKIPYLAQNLNTFPNLTGLSITFGGPCTDAYESAFLAEVLRHFSEYPGYSNIRSLELHKSFITLVEAVMKIPMQDGNTTRLSSLQEREKENLKNTEPMVNLERLGLRYHGVLSLLEHSKGWEWAHLRLLRSSAARIKRLDLRVSDLYYGYDTTEWRLYLREVKIRFPVLETLCITIDSFMSWKTLDLITTAAPNLKHLAMDTKGVINVKELDKATGEEILYPQLTKLKNLETVLISWPGRIREPTQVSRGLERPKMRQTVSLWIKNGLEKLTSVRFVVWKKMEMEEEDLGGFHGGFRSKKRRYLEAFEVVRKGAEVEVVPLSGK